MRSVYWEEGCSVTVGGGGGVVLSYLGIVIGVEIRVFRALPGGFDSLLPRELRWPEGSGQIIF